MLMREILLRVVGTDEGVQLADQRQRVQQHPRRPVREGRVRLVAGVWTRTFCVFDRVPGRPKFSEDHLPR